MSDDPVIPLDPEEHLELMQSTLNFPIVGIGASAGGLGAILRFFEQMPADNGMAFVIILHLSPKHESNAAAILQRATRMPVVQVTERMPIEPNHVYVIPPTHDLSMNDGHLQLTVPERVRGAHLAIDLFFRTLAQVHMERAVAVVMSGTGADGAVGLARIKERGGITLVQAPDDAEYEGMPKAAIATGVVDFVLSAVEMPQRLVSLWANASRISLPANDDLTLKTLPIQGAEAEELAEVALRDIMTLLRSYSKNDFRHYKRATVLRRIERRLQVRSLPNLPAYRDFLREHPEEAKPLLQDMLISVTNFFRDRDAFEAVEREVIPNLLSARCPDQMLRVWVAGCASGEEAYSISMLLREQLDHGSVSQDFQVFATDIDERAISAGRAGLYPESIVSDVTPGRLRQFFSREQDNFRVAKYVREKVLFAEHNVLRDPPFSRLDLICCRNLLIYLDREAQSGILEMFRFALKPGGYLFLGTSESADAAPNLFTVVDKKNRIYKTNPLSHAMRHLTLPVDSAIDRAQYARSLTGTVRDSRPKSFADIHQQCIGQVIAPSVLIDRKHNVLHLSDNVGQFMQHASGAPSLNLLSNVQPALRAELRTALFQASHTNAVAQTRPVSIKRGDSEFFVRMSVRMFEAGESAGTTLVMFEEVQPAPSQSDEAGDSAHDHALNQLEMEIRQLKEHLQETIEQTEASTEELKASNEELQAINEELRSATEELETSKEELQSINEELITVNFELKVKVDETGKINDDLQNLIASSDIATVFIDRSMRIKRFTPQAASIFNLIASDTHRSLLDITHRLDYDALASDTERVVKSLNTVERHVRSSDGKHYLARIRPYRTTDDRIDGAVLTFVDVTALRHAEENLRLGEERMRIAAETTKDYAILTVDEGGIVTTWNLGAERMFGYHEDEILGKPITIIFTPEDRATGVPEQELRNARRDGRAQDERWHIRKDGTTFYCSGVTSSMEGEGGGYVKIARDMTENRARQADRDEMLARELASNELKDQFLAVMSHELKHPLNLIQVNAELLISQPEVRGLPAVVRAGETIRLAVASQSKIIDDLLDLSRARTGKLQLSLEAVKLNELVTAIAAAVHDLVEQKGLKLTVDADEACIVAYCDRVRTEQIFWNLINNAIKFTPAGGKVSMHLGRDGEFARFTVNDTGRGIAPEFLPEVFGMFIQAPNQMVSQDGGLGVGLALVRDLTVAQGGKVLVESAGLNRGASFSVWLPLSTGQPGLQPVPDKTATLKGLYILAVDDMLDSLEPFAALLQIEGARVDIASSGKEALDRLDTNTYDLLISDLGMEGMDGFALIREIRQRPELQSLKTIALSGYGRPVDVTRALRSGFDGHLSKPATLEKIRQAVARLGQSADGV